jgi:hypothetical protein
MSNKDHLRKLDEGVGSWNRWRKERPDIMPDLSNADLSGRLLANMDFRYANFDGANLSNAELTSASLSFTSFVEADLSGARLRRTNLHGTRFKETLLRRTNFHNALLRDTEFLNVDLSAALNFETVLHPGSSTIGIDTIQRSKGKIPAKFLYGAGVSEQLVECIRSLGFAPSDYYTCFISYSSRDDSFVKALCQDLHKAGVRYWFAPENLKAGQKFPAHITRAIQSYEKVLVVLSTHALKSDWVGKEVEIARQRESGGKEVLVPIRLDNAIHCSKVDWAVAIRKKRHIGDFENCQQHQKRYRDALTILLETLQKK